ncbi:type II secretion system F family protein [Nocardiopsis suaedae]|uniref:Type II secretion system F family protein n=1 Tax=Nocardiopsis suaedae TaxID=3018444 RepID=A0ABT4TRH0_9ACTN|nr:type II secretion system F family protein [Nocardiopsis suaedae]MDA2807268.1 type II secretion system F family protein [Nocardiopsis suaedae]
MFLITVLLLITGVVFILGAREWGAGLDQNAQFASRSALAEVERRANSPFNRFDTWFRNTDIGKKLEIQIARAGMKVPVAVFALMILVTAVVAIIFVGRILAPLFGVLAAVLVGFLFITFLKRREERRREEFIAQLPELARVLSNATQAGLALPTAIAMAADELDDPAGAELQRAAHNMRLGKSFEGAIADMRERMPSREIGVLISTLLIASRSGGALVTALRNISDTLEQRKETRREIRTILSETKGTAWALLTMGILALFGLNALNPGSVEKMLESLIGVGILVAVATLFTVGMVIVQRMTKINY